MTKYFSLTETFFKEIPFKDFLSSISDADYNQLDSDTYEIHGEQSGSYSVVLTAPANTAIGAIGIYADHGTAFQDCVVLETVPTPEPTLGSIAGNVWFDENSNSTANCFVKLYNPTLTSKKSHHPFFAVLLPLPLATPYFPIVHKLLFAHVFSRARIDDGETCSDGQRAGGLVEVQVGQKKRHIVVIPSTTVAVL